MTEQVWLAVIGGLVTLFGLIITNLGKHILDRTKATENLSNKQLDEAQTNRIVTQKHHQENTRKLDQIEFLTNGNNAALQKALAEAYDKLAWMEAVIVKMGGDPTEEESKRIRAQRKAMRAD